MVVVEEWFCCVRAGGVEDSASLSESSSQEIVSSGLSSTAPV